MRKNFELIWLRGLGALKADTQNSYLGSLWWVLEPLLLSGLLFIAFASGIRGSGNTEFLFFLITGLLPLKWTSSCLGGGANSIIVNKGIIGQVYLPKWIFPSSVNLSMLIRFLFVLPVLMTMLSYGGFLPSVNWINILTIVCCQLILNLGTSFLFSSAVPLLPDLKHLVPLITMGLMFTSGIFFDISEKPEEIQEILQFNPLVAILDSYRAVLLRNESLPAETLEYSWMFGILTMIAGLVIMKLFDRHYPRALS
jgi:lipopolysaccharide transport system permease protein